MKRTCFALARRRVLCALLACLALGPGIARPEVSAPHNADLAEGVIPVKVIAGRLIARCDVSTPKRRISINVAIELENTCGLALHNNVCNRDGLDADRNNWPITLHFPGFDIPNVWREKGPEAAWGDFTKVHAQALGETPLAGTIGAGLLRKYHVTLDVPGGAIDLKRPTPRAVPGAESENPAEEAAAEQVDGAHRTAMSLDGGLAWLPVVVNDGSTRALALGTARPMGRVDAGVLRALTNGDAAALRLRTADLDLAAHVVLRPGPISEAHPDGAVGTTGLDLLSHFRIEIDHANKRVTLWPTDAEPTLSEDRAFVAALAAPGHAALGAYLERFEDKARHRAEAAEVALDRALEAGLSDLEAWKPILKSYVLSRPEKRRATSIRTLMVDLATWELFDAARHVAELGIEHGRKDKDPNAVHHLHATLGQWLLERGELDDAWRHLLSAAFGLPEDGRVNLNLGRLYEQKKRYARAFSRYVQALIAPDSGPQALEALQRVQAQVPQAERFGVDLVERAIAGKGHDFTAPDKYKPKKAAPPEAGDLPDVSPRRVALVEMFTNVGPRGVIAGDLAFHGLVSHFEPKHAVFVMHHLPAPVLAPLCSLPSAKRAQRVERAAPTALVVDGVLVGGGGGKPREAEGIYRKHREHVIEAIARPTAYTLRGEAKLEKGTLRGHIDIEGPKADLRLHVWVIEAGVVFPGNSRVVIHRRVCRASLFPGGVVYKPDQGVANVAFSADLAKLGQDVDRFLASQKWRGTMVNWTTHIDPTQVRLVAFLERAHDRRVVQAVEIDPARTEDS